jgi:hypothetical protein
LVRAKEHLQGSQSKLTWDTGEETWSNLWEADIEDEFEMPAVQYLSQQFVDALCSSEGLAVELVAEIERVIFNAHPENERDGAVNFKELYDLKSAAALERRARHEEELEEASNALAEERSLKLGLKGLQKQKEDLQKQVAQDQKDKKSLIAKGHEERAKRHGEISAALEERKRVHSAAQAQLRNLNALKEDVSDFRSRRFPAVLSKLKQERADAGLTSAEWDNFSVNFTGDVDDLLQQKIAAVQKKIKSLGATSPPSLSVPSTSDPSTPLISADANLSELTISLLQKELDRLSALIGIDTQKSKQFAALGEKITKATQALDKLDKQIAHAAGADARIQLLATRRKTAYAQVFNAVTDLETQLRQLYEPLARRLTNSSGSLGKLSFSIKRIVDVERWARDGEALLDLRTNGPFKGQGALLAAAETTLLAAWEHGSGEDVSTAMSAFISANEEALRNHIPEGIDNRAWASSVGKWLRNTDHISVSYGLQYDEVDVERLSPGTRGIVLLLLFLGIDEQDDRPLIIDQPEENLDPQSVFDELVGRFREAKNRRQIIIVTHNANLVVNTDADQVIVANASPHGSGTLPNITYELGGLENPKIRKRVCEILEGGEKAFKERARRLRVSLGYLGACMICKNCFSSRG